MGRGRLVLRSGVLREIAEDICESVSRCSRVVVFGRLEQRSWETQEGEKRSRVEIAADEIAPSLRWATATITKNERRGPCDDDGGSRGEPQVGRRGGHDEEPF